MAAGEIDTAIVWGPIGGYFARAYEDRLVLSPVVAATSPSDVPFAYAISVGVRDGNDALRAELDLALERRGPAIRALLKDFGVPLVATATGNDRRASNEHQ